MSKGKPTLSDMTFVMQLGEGSPKAIPLGKFGGKSRFAFGQLSRRAGIWQVTANPNGEVHLYERALGEFLKLSFHKTGEWRFSFVGENVQKNSFVEQAVRRKDSILIDLWRRTEGGPSSNAFVSAYTIFTTGLDLCTTDDPPELTDKVLWLDPPSEDEVAFLTLLYIKSTGTPFALKGMVPVDIIPMRTGEAILVTAARRTMTSQEVADLETHRETIQNSIRNSPDKISTRITPDMRALVHQQRSDGSRYALDLAVRPIAPQKGLAKG